MKRPSHSRLHSARETSRLLNEHTELVELLVTARPSPFARGLLRVVNDGRTLSPRQVEAVRLALDKEGIEHG